MTRQLCGAILRDLLPGQLGDAMAAVYTLGVLNGTHVHHNLLHDVYAWYTGGYCLSQDQGSSHILFEVGYSCGCFVGG